MVFTVSSMVSWLQAGLTLSWLAWIAAGSLLHLSLLWRDKLPPLLVEALTYGKLRAGRREQYPLFSVPKRWFTHFYAWGTLWNCFILYQFASRCLLTWRPSWSGPEVIVNTLLPSQMCTQACYSLQCFEVLLALILICCQVVRRLYECVWVNVFSDSNMHIAHYILGLYFYTALGPTALVHLVGVSNALDPENYDQSSATARELFGYCRWYHLAATAIFIWASWHQATCHRILAQLRTPTTEGGVARGQRTSLYTIPEGDWFDHVTCPHYLAEIIIYSALFLVMGGGNTVWLLVVLFTACILFLSARQTHAWYKMRFKNYPHQRTILLPWLL